MPKGRLSVLSKVGKYEAVRGYKASKKSLIYLVTSDKFLQGLVTGGVFAIINKMTVNIAFGINIVLASVLGVRFYIQTVSLVLVSLVVAFAFWADSNTDAWREWVEDKTGEDSADDGE